MNDLEEMCRQHFNEPVLLFGHIARLIGYGEDDHDCYLICKEMGGKVIWHTCVGGYIWLNSLRDQNPVISANGVYWDDFYKLKNFLAVNQATEEPTFISEVR